MKNRHCAKAGRLVLRSLFFGFAFGVGGIASAILGNFIDSYGIEAVYKAVCFSPLLGLVAIFLPDKGNGDGPTFPTS